MRCAAASRGHTAVRAEPFVYVCTPVVVLKESSVCVGRGQWKWRGHQAHRSLCKAAEQQ